MKTFGTMTHILTQEKKAAVKARGLASMLTSFKIEGVTFSPKQIESIKSRVHLAK